ncbi:sulfite oxidase [Halalkalicoccus jeotgali]|uniref:Oxidoreductase molybdopterin binding protein n=1 Tax=Halalkalicoccus jeotgali (strain DSM 18796 / CECT 7217 / JCM 14584 / KCTC 4019 / B3) TaxID=795797 RepID=D8J8J8_HALJB|nr:sulfite oxidase [Halalkalicoccus jeotgali]ADJ16244.1 oxidoreductase molybdopterin binding protein [Halalkalicoccus jeotgali B3]ELY36979.1 oxidoreductase molybdopterin binding protein [Halalkalicoccus jeotgali B3]
MPRELRPGGEPPLDEEFPNLAVLSKSPENAEVASRSDLDGLLTPAGTHYIRNHYPTPETDAAGWEISLTGLVDGSGETGPDAEGPTVGFEELREDYPTESVVHTMECSGNGRASFEPDAEGHQWTDGAVSTAVWTGTPVRALLEEYGATDEGWVAVVGGDAPEGEEVFCRSLPIGKVREDCVLAYEMNGGPLPPDHGHPVRLLVPGWFGNNSVKWVDRIHVADSMPTGEEWEGYTKYQQLEYRLRFDDDDEPEELDSVETTDTDEQMAAEEPRHAYFFDQLPKSLITAPTDGTSLSADETVEIRGLAWAGETPVERVGLSVDGGETWTDTDLGEPALGRYAWRRFRTEWYPEAGEYRLLARATDAKGRTQPARIADPDPEQTGIAGDAYPWNTQGYGNNAHEPLGVSVRVGLDGV